MFKRIKSFFLPFQAIASELSILRELYELDLANRKPPIYRITESPNKHDTEVTYGDDGFKEKTRLQRMFEGLEEEEDDD